MTSSVIPIFFNFFITVVSFRVYPLTFHRFFGSIIVYCCRYYHCTHWLSLYIFIIVHYCIIFLITTRIHLVGTFYSVLSGPLIPLIVYLFCHTRFYVYTGVLLSARCPVDEREGFEVRECEEKKPVSILDPYQCNLYIRFKYFHFDPSPTMSWTYTQPWYITSLTSQRPRSLYQGPVQGDHGPCTPFVCNRVTRTENGTEFPPWPTSTVVKETNTLCNHI